MPPDEPCCRSLISRKVIYDIPEVGKVAITRPNPRCQKAIGEADCGWCTWTVSDRDVYVGEAKEHWLNGKPWSQIEREAPKIPAESYAIYKAYLLDACKKSGQCGDIAHWRIKLDALDSLDSAIPAPTN